jgi:hypothetical protein
MVGNFRGNLLLGDKVNKNGPVLLVKLKALVLKLKHTTDEKNIWHAPIATFSVKLLGWKHK